MEPLLVVLFAFLGAVIACFLLTFLLVRLAFNRRNDNHPRLRYFTSGDFKGLSAEPVSFYTKPRNRLRGFIYCYPENRNQELILFSHGIGAGHQAYMHFIEEFARAGYVVFAYDNTGSQCSEGKSIRGFPQAAIDIEYALRFIEAEPRYAGQPKYLVGHSLGAYAVLQALGSKHEIKKAIAIAPFNDVSEIMGAMNPVFRTLRPFVNTANFLRFGSLAFSTSAKALKKSKVPALIISGALDPVVPPKTNFEVFKKATILNPKIEYYLVEGQKHNPYLTVESEQYIIEMILSKTAFMDRKAPKEVAEAHYQSIDYSQVGNHNPLLFKKMIDYLNRG